MANNDMTGAFVTGCATDVGKTVATGALLAALAKLNGRALAIKPVQTGATPGAMDSDIYGLFAPKQPCATLFQFRLAASPDLAARMEGKRLDAASLAAAVRSRVADAPCPLIEGAGGVRSPLNETETMLDLILALNLPVILVCSNVLGAVNAALLSLGALADARTRVAALILNDVSARTESIIRSDNEAWLSRAARSANGAPLFIHLPHVDMASREDRARLVELMEPLARRLSPDET